MAIHFLNADGSPKSVEYKGQVLAVYKNVSYQIMSDIWGYADEALVWDKENKCAKKIHIRACDYTWDTPSYAEVDATKAVKAAYRKNLINTEFGIRKARALKEAGEIVKDCMVEVVKGRKVPKGTKGKVVVMMDRETGWGYRRYVATKLGIATSDVMVDVLGKNGKTYKNHLDMEWVWAYNCRRIDAPGIDEAQILKAATNKVDYELGLVAA
jgi:hypothetical protein